MKRILITGNSSYVGCNVKCWMENKDSNKYVVNTISLRGEKWKEEDFSLYDVVIHAAGIAHIKETAKNRHQYFKINRDLAFEVALKSKNDGVGHFIFLSSMSVYGVENGVIDKNTHPSPRNSYGLSKLQAEELITTLESKNFKVAILRPPMIYGKDCRGNYRSLAKFAKTSPIFPDYKNKRSMIFINNLSEFIRLIIDNNSEGLFCPQNNEYVCTSIMVKYIAAEHGKTLIMVKLFNRFIKLFNFNVINKVFGDLVYDKDLSFYKGFETISTKESIKLTESII